MGTEIERKFIVDNDSWKEVLTPYAAETVHQFYLPTGDVTTRIRRTPNGDVLTFKTRAGHNTIARNEWEFDITHTATEAELQDILRLSKTEGIRKTRHRLPAGKGLVWEIDVFEGKLDGLVLAEIELSREDEEFERPDWLGDEVTHDERYYNQCLDGMSFPLPNFDDFHTRRMRDLVASLVWSGESICGSREGLIGAVRYVLHQYCDKNNLSFKDLNIEVGNWAGKLDVSITWK